MKSAHAIVAEFARIPPSVKMLANSATKLGMLANSATLRCLVLLGLLLVMTCGCGDNNANIGRARLALKTLDKAVGTYKAAKGVLPDQLEALTEQRPGGGGEFVTANALVDPWGRRYQYDPTKLHPENDMPLIWSEGPSPGEAGSKITNWEVKDEGGGV